MYIIPHEYNIVYNHGKPTNPSNDFFGDDPFSGRFG